MIRTLRLDNYRSFEEYELRDLARVNLLVGRNDCGKTCIPEAVELLASRGDPRVIIESVRRRGESHGGLDGTFLRNPVPYLVYHQFHGYRIEFGGCLGIGSDDGLGRVQIHHVKGRSDESGELFDGQEAGLQPLALLIKRGNEQEILKC